MSKPSRWKDRQVILNLPIFPGYVFTRIIATERLKVLSTPSVIHILSYRGVPAPVSDDEIDAVRLCVSRGATLQPHRFIAVGDRVRVKDGVFEGLQGIVVRYNNSCKVVVSIGLIHQSAALEIDADSLEQILPTANPRPALESLRTSLAH
jgi:transcription antitermination factor NusG